MESSAEKHTLVEHALCPLDVRESLAPGSLHAVRYDYTDHNRNRRTATAQVACPFGLSPHDELYLYGLLALTFSQPELYRSGINIDEESTAIRADVYATPHWCLKQLGIVDAGNEQGKAVSAFPRRHPPTGRSGLRELLHSDRGTLMVPCLEETAETSG